MVVSEVTMGSHAQNASVQEVFHRRQMPSPALLPLQTSRPLRRSAKQNPLLPPAPLFVAPAAPAAAVSVLQPLLLRLLPPVLQLLLTCSFTPITCMPSSLTQGHVVSKIGPDGGLGHALSASPLCKPSLPIDFRLK